MKSSAEKLNDSMLKVQNSKNVDEILLNAKKSAENIADLFQDINTSLEQAWRKSAENLDNISSIVAGELGKVSKEIQEFAQETMEIERAANNAAEEANSLSKSIISELENN